jgi:MIP family channel proteins
MNEGQPKLVPRLLAEFIGTFGLVFVGCGAMMVDAKTGGQLGHVGVSMTFGLVIMAMVFAVGHISGAHFNPVVTLAFWVIKKFPADEVPWYWAAQFAAAIAAAVTLYFLVGDVAGIGATQPDGTLSDLQAVGLEVILTFFLMFVITAVATDSRSVGALAGVGIGGAVALGSLMGGPLTGASMNPARSLGPALINGDVAEVWIYVVGPMVGAVLGALAYQLSRGETKS